MTSEALAATTVTVPGPKPSLLEAFSYRPGRDPLAFFTDLARTW